MDRLISTTTEPFTILFQYPNDNFYDREWFIVLIGVFVGAILTFLFGIFRDLIKERNLKKTMAKNLFTEINILRIVIAKGDESRVNVINQFKRMVEANHFTAHPSISFLEAACTDFYRAYLKDLGMFDDKLRFRISIFYAYYKNIESSSRSLEKRFCSYYNGEKTTGPQDVIFTGEKLIKQAKSISLIGAEAISDLINKYKTDTFIKSEESIKNKKLIKGYLKNIKKNDIINIEELAKKFNVHIIFSTTILFRMKNFEDMGKGNYKKL
jgi:hypothetical protein